MLPVPRTFTFTVIGSPTSGDKGLASIKRSNLPTRASEPGRSATRQRGDVNLHARGSSPNFTAFAETEEIVHIEHVSAPRAVQYLADDLKFVNGLFLRTRWETTPSSSTA